MQDIPRNELLDKLAAGWKCRRKKWASHVTIAVTGGSTTTLWTSLLEDDWEGEPPEPVLNEAKCSIIHAFWQLRNGAAFIRRTAWKDKDKRYTQGVVSISLHIDELLATDWEVWVG